MLRLVYFLRTKKIKCNFFKEQSVKIENFMASSSHLQIPWKQPGIYLQEAGHQFRKKFSSNCVDGGRKGIYTDPFLSPTAQTSLFWKLPQNMANKPNFRKIRLCINTEPSLLSLKVRQCSFPFSQNVTLRSPCTKNLTAGTVLGWQSIIVSVSPESPVQFI